MLCASTSCASGMSEREVASKCSARRTKATITLTKGVVVPAALTKSMTDGVGPLYAKICRAIVTAPAGSDGPHSCPAYRVASGRVVVKFFTGDRVVDTLDLKVTGCQSITSTALGRSGLLGAQLQNYEVAWNTIMDAFKIQPAQLGSGH